MYAQNIKKPHLFSPVHESTMNTQARQESKRTKALTHCGLAALLSKLLTATPAILTIWGVSRDWNNFRSHKTKLQRAGGARAYESGGGEQGKCLYSS